MSDTNTVARRLEVRDAHENALDVLSDAFVVHHRNLLDNPAETLHSVERARDLRRMVAVDDVGTGPESLTLLPLIEPDIIVLAPELARRDPDTAAARTVHVVAAQAERTGALIVARGVDSEDDRARALALGATFGVGEMYSNWQPSVGAMHDAHVPPTWNTPTSKSTSPFDIAADGRIVTPSSKKLLVAMSTQIEWQAASAGADTMTLGTFQHARRFGHRTRRRWNTMARRIAYTGVYGIAMDTLSDPGITHFALDPADPLVEEWNVVVLGQFFCCVLSAREVRRVDDKDDERDRLFEYVVSHDRATVVRCARAILSRAGKG
ncbi:EAL domain-containing protein [Rhodococcus sp. G-MC3]|uniref:DICT sensory domain-containing protein n=1 Tax=Rhodococcus sp. G-MC3 TaxID=3046209 RepID=UPI0024B95AA2|nr:DICT sensory domain-containing protein [Rhodococcus sp. G-MC3]MDJ0392861.1 EAL domain-containing protein [Rhodococcus sp. G-MC3]